ncbi:MAG: hypothetical protein EB078_05365 [Proteobacteria bacterium]|nr:hypothetical protein [Pseudomonadota bacterium]NDD04314.1 hypothetical protein [Pseudomonadota bacterium]NDG26287.1 hypothetical protein [Pseudomonadota bacterium]
MWAWCFLLGAGIVEIAWALTLKMTNGYQHMGYLIVNVLIGLAGSYLLALALKHIPITTAYPIWKGIAIGGLVFLDLILEKKPLDMYRIFFITLIVGGIIGLKAVPE